VRLTVAGRPIRSREGRLLLLPFLFLALAILIAAGLGRTDLALALLVILFVAWQVGAIVGRRRRRNKR
jgi:hypothetical protein